MRRGTFKKVEFLKEYGHYKVGDTAELREWLAEDLEKEGVVKVVGDSVLS
jgi:hypothetical protein